MINNLTPKQKILLKVIGFMIGLLTGCFLVFQVLFLYRVLPHGGL